MPNDEEIHAVSRIRLRIDRGEKFGKDDLQFLYDFGNKQLDKSDYWKHLKSGDVYLALGVVLREKDLILEVRYSPENSTEEEYEYTRPLSEFLEKFRPVERAPGWKEIE